MEFISVMHLHSQVVVVLSQGQGPNSKADNGEKATLSTL